MGKYDDHKEYVFVRKYIAYQCILMGYMFYLIRYRDRLFHIMLHQSNDKTFNTLRSVFIMVLIRKMSVRLLSVCYPVRIISVTGALSNFTVLNNSLLNLKYS